MKKPMLLIFLCYIFLYPIFANTTSSNEKLDLSPKIKKGDSWNLVFKLNTNTNENNNIYPIGTNMGFEKFNACTEWQVECLEALNSQLTLKFTLLKFYKTEIFGIYGNVINYTDTEYPVFLDKEYYSKIKEIIGKSFTCKLAFDNKRTTEIITDEFKNKKILIPGQSLMPQNTSFLYFVNFNFNYYAFIGPTSVTRFFLDIWNSILPNENVKQGKKWFSKELFGDTIQRPEVKIAEITNNSIRLQIGDENESSSVILDKELSIPIVLNTPQFQTYIYNFNQIPNTVIKGNSKGLQLNVKGYLNLSTPDYALSDTIHSDNGKFEFGLNLKKPLFGIMTMNSRSYNIFLTPGMRINLMWDQNKEKPIVTGYGAEDVKCVMKFWNERYYIDYGTDKYSKKDIIEKTCKYREKIDDILYRYADGISKECKTFIETETTFRIANQYLESREEIERERSLQRRNGLDINKAMENANYFMSFVDSLNLVGNISVFSPAYQEFIPKYLTLKQRIFLAQRGRRYDKDNIHENLIFAGLNYIGYPYYYSAYKLLETEILKGKQTEIKKELEDFNELPCNPAFSVSLKKLIEEMDFINAGKLFPYNEIVDTENKSVKIPKGFFTIIDFQSSFNTRNPQHQDEMEELTKIVKNDPHLESFNYVVVRPDFAKGKLPESESTDTVKFTYIYLPKGEDSILKKMKLLDGNQKRILLLDKERRIITNNLGRIGKYTGHKLPQIIDEYFESHNQPTSQAGNNRLLLVIMVCLAGFGLLSWGVIKVRTTQIRKKEAARRKLSELELKAIRSQMNPHFIFNAMGSIQNLINHNSIKNANLYLSSFARLMRMVLDNSNKKLVSLSGELDLLKNYLELEQLRIDFNFEISVDPDIDPETEEIPGMLVQPFVENAVIHGITPKGKGNILVHFSKTETILICTITDDGVGIKLYENGDGQGIALKLSEKRLSLLNSQFSSKLSLKAENRKDQENVEGTKITLLIPAG